MIIINECLDTFMFEDFFLFLNITFISRYAFTELALCFKVINGIEGGGDPGVAGVRAFCQISSLHLFPWNNNYSQLVVIV